MELSLKKLLPIGLIVLAVMFVMKMMKGKRCEGFSQQKAQKVTCNCNVEKFSSSPDCNSLKNPPDGKDIKEHLYEWICNHEKDTVYDGKIDDCLGNLKTAPKEHLFKYAQGYCPSIANFANLI